MLNSVFKVTRIIELWFDLGNYGSTMVRPRQPNGDELKLAAYKDKLD